MSSTSVKTIKRRIRSAKNIKQITKAMEMVSASKMRRAQDKALTTRPYSQKMREVFGELAGQVDPRQHPMLTGHLTETGVVGIILVSSDRGLCGALNTNLFRQVDEFRAQMARERREEVLSFEYITIGKKSREFVLKTGQSLHAEFTNFPERPQFEDALPIARLSIDGFVSGKFREIYLMYTAFISTLTQEVNFIRLLPVEAAKIGLEEPERMPRLKREYIFEPGADEVVAALLPHYLEIQVYQTILEAFASEHSARMVAMRNASDNATEIIDELALIYNKQRQQSITNEISDLITSRMAVTEEKKQ